MKILILTSSFEKDLDPFLNGEYTIFSANWGINFNIPLDYYFCSTDEDLLISEINKNSHLVKNWMITQNIKNKLTSLSHNSKIINLFEFLQNIGDLGKKHMLPKNKRKNLDLPTTGVQMIYSTLAYSPSKLIIRGMNLYSSKNSNGGYKVYGNTAFENPNTMKNKPHSLITDVAFIYSSFKKMIQNKISESLSILILF